MRKLTTHDICPFCGATDGHPNDHTLYHLESDCDDTRHLMRLYSAEHWCVLLSTLDPMHERLFVVYAEEIEPLCDDQFSIDGRNNEIYEATTEEVIQELTKEQEKIQREAAEATENIRKQVETIKRRLT